MRPGCFVSYKTEDERYKDLILRMNIGAYARQPGAGTACYDESIAAEDAREQILADSKVTIFIIGKYSAECLGLDEQKYIKKELRASLCAAQDGLPGSVLGLVLPEAEGSVFQGTYICPRCGGTHKKAVIDDSTVIREFSQNFSSDSCKGIGFCVLAAWSDFKADPERYIKEAYMRRYSIKGAKCSEKA